MNALAELREQAAQKRREVECLEAVIALLAGDAAQAEAAA